jgi:molecular chaperone GrpE
MSKHHTDNTAQAAVSGDEEARNQQNGNPEQEQTVNSANSGPESACTEANPPEEDAPEAKIAALEAKVAELNDQYLRKAADFENFRKRMAREKQDAIDYANQSLLLDLIPVIDDFDRAIQSAEIIQAAEQRSVGDFDKFLEGIGMIEKRLSSQLESRWGLKGFISAGEAFDPNRHEALMMEKSAEVSEPLVKEDLLKGYTLKERVIRPAKVKVIMPDAQAGSANPAGNAAQGDHSGAQ